jgi:hypothetical protein
MKRLLVPFSLVSLVAILVSGCSWQVGGGSKSATNPPTVGQQLIDLQKAKDAGAITDSEYQTQKTKLLGSK